MPIQVKSAIDELEQLWDNSTTVFYNALRNLAKARIGGNFDMANQKLSSLETIIWQTMSLSDLLGRRRLIFEADAKRARQPKEVPIIAFAETPVLPNVPFEEAIDDIISRQPELTESSEQVQEVYARHGFALAQSSDLRITQKIQQALADFARKGIPEPEGTQILAAIDDFTRAYAQTVYRTNLNTSYTAGRFKQAQDTDVAEVIGAFQYVAILDSTVRPNHRAAHGLIASQFDAVWETFSPPLGFNCRCGVKLVDKFSLKQRGLIQPNGIVLRVSPANFSEAFPDSGFGRTARPDRLIYG